VRILALAVVLVGCGRVGFSTDRDASTPTWALAQVTAVDHGTQISISAGAGDLLVLESDPAAHPDQITSVTDDSGDVFAPIPQGRQNLNAYVGFELFYVEGARRGTHTITVSMMSGTGTGLVAWDVTGIATSASLHTAVGQSNSSASATPQSPQLATAVPGEFVLAIATFGTAVVGLPAGSPFTLDATVGGDGQAHLTDPHAPIGIYQAEWDVQVAASYCSTIVGFLPVQ
jgi:hypothetical protein